MSALAGLLTASTCSIGPTLSDSTPTAGDGLSLRWALGHAGTVCSNYSRICRTFAHVVFTATPADGDATHALVGGAEYTLDNGTVQYGGSAVFERHLVSGTCDGANCTQLGPSLMFNWGYEAVRADDDRLVSAVRHSTPAGGMGLMPSSFALSDAKPFPKVICVRAWLRDPLHSGGAVVFTPDSRCVAFSPPQTPQKKAGGVVLTLNNFSTAATSFCVTSKGIARCRNNLHVVFSATAADPTHPLVANGEYSFDAGRSWQSAGGAAFYEQHIDLGDDGLYRQAMQFDVDLASSAPLSGNVCYRIRVRDSVSGDDSLLLEDCLTMCRTLAPFHNPLGYCPGAPV